MLPPRTPPRRVLNQASSDNPLFARKERRTIPFMIPETPSAMDIFRNHLAVLSFQHHAPEQHSPPHIAFWSGLNILDPTSEPPSLELVVSTPGHSSRNNTLCSACAAPDCRSECATQG